MYQALRPALRAFALLALLSHSALAQTSALTIQPRGAHATAGTIRTVRVGTRYEFRYEGGAFDESRTYAVDTNHADVKNGLIRVEELVSGSIPIAKGGLAWRTGTADGQVEPPVTHASSANALLYHEHLDPKSGKLTLKYTESKGGIAARKTFEFWLVGKVLKVRAYGDTSVNDRFVGNYARLEPGRSELTPAPVEQQIPYMDSSVVYRFTAPLPETAPVFVGFMLDWFRVNGACASFGIGAGALDADSFEHFYPSTSMRSNALQSSPWKILANVDDTLNLIVTRELEDTFVVPSSYRSPYYRLTSGRMMMFGGSNASGAWDHYQRQYDQRFASYGLTDLTVMQYQTRRFGADFLTPADSPASPMGLSAADLLPHSGAPVATVLGNVRPVKPLNDDGSVNQPLAAEVDEHFVPLAKAARDMGAVFASCVSHDINDQWGQGSSWYTPSTAPGVVNFTYPIDIPFHVPQWKGTVASTLHRFGLIYPAANPGYQHSRSVLTWDNKLTPGWDAGLNTTPDSSWTTYGFKFGTVDPHYVAASLADQYRYGQQNYHANAVLYDASHVLAQKFRIDQTTAPASQKVHTASELERLRNLAVRTVRADMGGPMYGEGSHWRWGTDYDHGTYDGLRHGFPTDDLATRNTHNSWVIPDYNLREVLAKSAGHSGMSHENQHWTPLVGEVGGSEIGPPYDGGTGDFARFIDSYITTSATYGNNAYAGTNGDVQNNFYTYQGLLRHYALLAGLSRRMREGALQEVRYFKSGGAPQGYDLAGALVAGVNLKRPWIKLTFDNGLVFFANHDLDDTTGVGAPWPSQTVLDTNGTPVQIDIGPNGFAAGDGSQLFELFNSKPSGSPDDNFDYVRYEKRWEMINTRAPNTSGTPGVYSGISFNNFPTSAITGAFTPSDIDLFSDGLILHDKRLNKATGATAGLWNPSSGPAGAWTSGKVVAVSLGTQPVLQSIVVQSEATQLYTNKPEGFVAIGQFADTISGPIVAWQDVTTLVNWSVQGPATVNKSGAVTATSPGGNVTVTATYTPGPGSFGNLQTSVPVSGSKSINTAAGNPSIPNIADKPTPAGKTIVLDATSSSDPKGGVLRYDWNFGDGSSASGAVVQHTYNEPTGAPWTAVLSVTDVEGNVSTDTFAVNVKWTGSTLWADDFDDGVLEGWNPAASSLFGVHGGTAETPLSTGTQLLTVTGATHKWQQLSAGAEVRLVNTGTSANAAGLHVRKTTEADLPTTSGYRAAINGLGQVVFAEAAGTPITAAAGLDLARKHDLRIVTQLMPDGQHRIRVYADGVKQIETLDPTPPAQGFAGLYTQSQRTAFDEFRVTETNAPYISVFPMELDSDQATKLSFTLDDQDLYPNLNPNALWLVVRDEQHGIELAPIPASQLAPLIETIEFETGDPNTSTWVRLTFLSTVEGVMDLLNTDSVSFEFTQVDLQDHVGRRYVRFDR
jgi:hypothetical protein